MPNTSLGSRVKVEPFTFIGNSLIMDDTAIGSHSRIIDTVTGQGCRLADHTTTAVSAKLMNIEGSVIKPEFGDCAWRSGHLRAFHGLQKLYCGK